ncbi:phytochelatin synthase family protein [Legionella cardiaca]|uniref:glutathione gamma-glutamylcysteinyltransferase n=1 Tax=Legionella cardiaca TaxID=1071983 RepID=A0ABY8AVI3_9GAMM|nr:phytochelatin synthase family protein [Legionella cardiaca]WED44488.1 phytochelatin synthase family protein [Legionella cardiaca]
MATISRISRRYFILFFFAISFSHTCAALQSAPPRYAPEIISILQSHAYIQEHKAPLYWKLSPYYIHQRNDSSCSLATAAMVINAALSNQLFSKTKLATQDDILNRVKDKDWEKGVQVDGDGVTLEQFKLLLAKAFEAYGLHGFTIQLIHTQDSSKSTESVLHKHLIESEAGQSFIIANFNQKFFTGDESVGHFAPIGAYDMAKRRILIMDPDRTWYEPYWVPEKTLLEAMATKDMDAQQYRGYLVIKFNENRNLKASHLSSIRNQMSSYENKKEY